MFRSIAAAIVILVSAQQPQTESGRLTLTQAGNEIATERYTRTADALEGELRAPTGLRVNYKASLSGGVVTQMTLTLFAATDSVKPAQTATVRFAADTMTLETVRSGAPVVEKKAAPRGAVPYLMPSAVWMGEIVRKARAQGGTTVTVPVAILSAPQQIMNATVTFTSATQAKLQLADIEVSLTLDASGRIEKGEAPAQNIVITRAS